MVTSDQGDKPKARGARGRYVRSASTTARDIEAVQLRFDGLTYQAIADRMGYSHRDLARRAVQRCLVATVREASEEVRQIELARLDRWLVDATAVLRREHVTVSQGRIIRDDAGKPLLDDGPVLAAIDRLLKIQERRAKLLGLDAPTKHEVVTMDSIEAEITRLNAEIGAMNQEP